MTPIAPHLTAFLKERLPIQRAASQHTCDSYAYAFRLLLEYASRRIKLPPSSLHLEQLDAALIMDFLEYLEAKRGNSPTTRNVRLAAIKSFMRFLEYREPALLEHTRRVLAIPVKKGDTKLVKHLEVQEIQAILNAPDLRRRSGVRDRAMMHLCFNAGLRVSELVALPLSAVSLRSTPSVRVMGKGRRERILPLWKATVRDVRAWLAVRGNLPGTDSLFVNARGLPLTRAGFEYVLRKHTSVATVRFPTLASKRISPHVLRHTCAVLILRATGDLRKVSLWLGHSDLQTTEMYLRVDPEEKLKAMEAVVPPRLRPGRFRPTDALIASLQAR